MNTPEKSAEVGIDVQRLVRPVLILASYCGDDDTDCSDERPCLDCLKMCNVATAEVRNIEVVGGWDLLTNS